MLVLCIQIPKIRKNESKKNILKRQSNAVGSDSSPQNGANTFVQNSVENSGKVFTMGKSTLILIIIVSLFAITHSTRIVS